MDNNLEIKIGEKTFKNSDELNEWMSESMAIFLQNIQDYRIYTETDSIGDFPLSEYENGISFYYTKKGMDLVDRWLKRMKKVYNKYVSCDDNFNPECCMYKEV